MALPVHRGVGRWGAALLLWLAGTAVAAAEVETLVNWLDGLATLRAEFSQTRYDEYGAELERARGHCLVKRPGRFRWDYVEPYLQTLVTDGRTLWIHDQDLEQVTVNTLDAQATDSPAALLGAEFQVLDRYTVGPLEIGDGLDWFLLTPRAAGEFKSVEVALRDGTLAAMKLVDNLGQTTRIDFSQVVRNGAVDDAPFQFVPPPGVDVIEGGGP